MSIHQKRRITEMLTHLLKDLAEIGVTFGNDTDLKVLPSYFILNIYINVAANKVFTLNLLSCIN